MVQKVERLFVQSSECDERIQSSTSPPYYITLLNCKYIFHGSTVEPRYNRGTQRQFSKNICSEDDLRSRIFGTFVVKFLAYLPLLGFSNI